jgi:hypothetical protein
MVIQSPIILYGIGNHLYPYISLDMLLAIFSPPSPLSIPMALPHRLGIHMVIHRDTPSVVNDSGRIPICLPDFRTQPWTRRGNTSDHASGFTKIGFTTLRICNFLQNLLIWLFDEIGHINAGLQMICTSMAWPSTALQQ